MKRSNLCFILYFSSSLCSEPLQKVLLAEYTEPFVVISIVNCHYYNSISSNGHILRRYPNGSLQLSNAYIHRHHLCLTTSQEDEIYDQLSIHSIQKRFLDFCSNIDSLSDGDEYELSKHNHKRLSINDIHHLSTRWNDIFVSYPIRTHLQSFLLYVNTHHQVGMKPTADTFEAILDGLKIATLLDGHRFATPKHVPMIDLMMSNRCCVRYIENIPSTVDPNLQLISSIHKKLPPIV